MRGIGQMSIEGELLLADIRARGYSEFQHGISGDEIDGLIAAYTDFTRAYPDPLPSTMDAMLPAEPTTEDLSSAKFFGDDGFSFGRWMGKNLDELNRGQDTQDEWHKYRTNAEGVGKPDGYSNRSFQQRALKQARGLAVDPSEDPKEFYHYTPRHYANMARNHTAYDWGNIPIEVTRLDAAFRPIHQKASELIMKVAGLIEETHPLIRDFFVTTSLSTSPVRLLFYHPGDSDQLGAGHYDKGSLTIQIAESHEGLRVAPNEDADLQPVVRSADKGVVFPGKALRENRGVGEDTPYQPGWHDIVRVSRLNEGRSLPPQTAEVCARWALIFFANGAGFVNPDKSETHNR